MPLERDAHRVILVSWENCLHIESSTPEAASEAGWIALDRIRAVKKLDRS